MIRFLLLSILILLVARAFWRVMDGVIQAASGRSPSAGPSAGAMKAMKLVRDPVCGTFVTPSTAVSLTGPGNGATRYFCSERCRDQFASTARRPASQPS